MVFCHCLSFYLRKYETRLAPVLKHFSINVPFHILGARLTLMALFSENRAIKVRLAPSKNMKGHIDEKMF